MLIIFVDVARFEAKSVTSKRLIMRRIAFYPVGGERVSLPERHIKAYVDDYCHEFGQTDTDTKLMHLLYVADKGFDILSHIREFLDNHPEIAQDSIKQTLAYFVSHLRYPEGDRYVDDQFAMANFLKETLSLEKVLDLLMMEIRLRFSYTEDDKSVNFTQKYLRWDSLASLKKSLKSEELPKCMVNPTGYYSVSESDIIKENLWPTLVGEYMRSHWYNENIKIVYPNPYEEQVIDEFNRNAKEDYKYVLGAPAEPWRGNPLKAKVVILSLNPGFKLGVNDNVQYERYRAPLEDAIAELINTLSFQVRGLLTPQESYVKSHEEFKEKYSMEGSQVLCGDALNEIGDYYWYNNINRLNINHQKEYEFFRNFAIVQYCAYTSISFKDFPRGVVLPSQELTKKLIRYLAYEREDVVFVIMRSAAKWKELLDADVWEKMQSRLIVNKNMSQSLSENNLGKKNFNMLIEYLK